MEYAAARETESPVFDDCPANCEHENRRRISFCPGCPIAELRREFENAARDELAKMPGREFSFEYLHRAVVETINAGSLPADRLTVTMARFRAILDGERDRRTRVERWNRDRNKPPA